jgi:hypothetical protein
MFGVSGNLQSDCKSVWGKVDNSQYPGLNSIFLHFESSGLVINVFEVCQRIKHWLVVGAQPSERVALLLGIFVCLNYDHSITSYFFIMQVRPASCPPSRLTASQILMQPRHRRSQRRFLTHDRLRLGIWREGCCMDQFGPEMDVAVILGPTASQHSACTVHTPHALASSLPPPHIHPSRTAALSERCRSNGQAQPTAPPLTPRCEPEATLLAAAGNSACRRTPCGPLTLLSLTD